MLAVLLLPTHVPSECNNQPTNQPTHAARTAHIVARPCPCAHIQTSMCVCWVCMLVECLQPFSRSPTCEHAATNLGGLKLLPWLATSFSSRGLPAAACFAACMGGHEGAGPGNCSQQAIKPRSAAHTHPATAHRRQRRPWSHVPEWLAGYTTAAPVASYWWQAHLKDSWEDGVRPCCCVPAATYRYRHVAGM